MHQDEFHLFIKKKNDMIFPMHEAYRISQHGFKTIKLIILLVFRILLRMRVGGRGGGRREGGG